MGTPSTLIHAEESGPVGAPLVVLVHGSLDRSAGMARVARVLQSRFRVLRYDRRGYGRSVAHPGPFGVADHVDDLQVLLDGRSAVLVGHSYGGNVALAASVRLGPAVTGVGVYETPMSWLSWWPGTTAGAAAAASSPEDAAEAFMRRLIGDEGWNSLPERTRAARRLEGTALRAELTALRESAPWNTDDVNVRVVCAHGSRGSAHHARGMEWLSASLARAELQVIEGAGHGAPNSHPAEFVQQVVMPLV